VEVKRGDVVLCSAPGDYGKPRPALVVQSDLFNPTHASVTLCPITSEVISAPLFRLSIPPARDNGLRKPSQIMMDKITSQPLKRIGKVIGKLGTEQMNHVDRALKLWLNLV
jgi:mRNA interferase MazF